MSMDMNEIHAVFFEESFEGVDTMEAGLLKLDAQSTDSELINTIFRAAHSINCLLYTSPSPRDRQKSRMPSSA